MAKVSLLDKLAKKVDTLLGVKPAQPQPSPPPNIPPRPVQPRPAQPPRPAQTEPFVYVTTGGKKFHYSRLCPGIRNAKEVKMPLSKARKAGYTACDKCCYSYLHD